MLLAVLKSPGRHNPRLLVKENELKLDEQPALVGAVLALLQGAWTR